MKRCFFFGFAGNKEIKNKIKLIYCVKNIVAVTFKLWYVNENLMDFCDLNFEKIIKHVLILLF